MNTAVYVLHRVSNRKSDVVPYTQWLNGKKADVSHLKVFGRTAYALVLEEQREKLDPKSKKGILVGYGDSNKLLRVFNGNERKMNIVTNIERFLQ